MAKTIQPENTLIPAFGTFRIIGFDWIDLSDTDYPYCTSPLFSNLKPNNYPVFKCMSLDGEKLMYLPLDDIYVDKLFECISIRSVGKIDEYDENYACGTIWHYENNNLVKGYSDSSLFFLSNSSRHPRYQHTLFIEYGSIKKTHTVLLNFEGKTLRIMANGEVNKLCRDIMVGKDLSNELMTEFVKNVRGKEMQLSLEVPFSHFRLKEHEINKYTNNNFDYRYLIRSSHKELYHPKSKEQFLRDLKQSIIYETPAISKSKFMKHAEDENIKYGYNYRVPVCNFIN